MATVRSRRAPALPGVSHPTPAAATPTPVPPSVTSRVIGAKVAIGLLLACLLVGVLAVAQSHVSTITWISVVGGLVALVIMVSECVLHRRRVHVTQAQQPAPHLSTFPDAVGAQAFLRRTFDHPSLRIGQWDPRQHCYLTHTGQPIDPNQAIVSYGVTPPPRRTHPAPLFHLTPQLMQAIQTALAEGQRMRDHLHDGTQHHLVSMCIHLRLLEERLLTTGEMPSPDALAQIRTALAACAGELATLGQQTKESTPASRVGLETIRALTAHSPVPVQWEACSPVSAALDHAPAHTAEAVYYTVAECLTNAWKHSSSTAITVTLRVNEQGQLVGSVSNDGCDPEHGTLRLGSGLLGLHRRLNALGGTVQYHRHHATMTVTFTLPVSVQEFEKQ